MYKVVDKISVVKLGNDAEQLYRIPTPHICIKSELCGRQCYVATIWYLFWRLSGREVTYSMSIKSITEMPSVPKGLI